MTSTVPSLPVALRASGVSSRMKTFHFFSSAMVDFPVVHLSEAARAASLCVSVSSAFRV